MLIGATMPDHCVQFGRYCQALGEGIGTPSLRTLSVIPRASETGMGGRASVGHSPGSWLPASLPDRYRSAAEFSTDPHRHEAARRPQIANIVRACRRSPVRVRRPLHLRWVDRANEGPRPSQRPPHQRRAGRCTSGSGSEHALVASSDRNERHNSRPDRQERRGILRALRV